MKTVLVCDDDEAILESLRIYLSAEGYNVLTAQNGIEALAQVQDNEIHCVVLDIMMPQLDGLKTTLKIREKYNFPIILLSAKSEDMDKSQGWVLVLMIMLQSPLILLSWWQELSHR